MAENRDPQMGPSRNAGQSMRQFLTRQILAPAYRASFGLIVRGSRAPTQEVIMDFFGRKEEAARSSRLRLFYLEQMGLVGENAPAMAHKYAARMMTRAFKGESDAIRTAASVILQVWKIEASQVVHERQPAPSNLKRGKRARRRRRRHSPHN